MKPSGHGGIRCACYAACASLLLAGHVHGGSRESQRIQPVFQNSSLEKPAFARPNRAKPYIFIPPRIVQPQREQLVEVRATRVKPKMEIALFENPDTRDIFRRPRVRLSSFPRGDLAPPPRHFVPGYGNNIKTYRLGSPTRLQDQPVTHDMYYFRDHRIPKPDDER